MVHIEHNNIYILSGFVKLCREIQRFNSMVEMQKFNLCWNEFDKAASAIMKNLVADQDFTDVTISCDDDETILAHKIVLGSSSPVFRYFVTCLNKTTSRKA